MEAAELDWSKRLDTIKGTPYALSYMQHDCNPPIVCHDVTRTNFYVELRIRGLFFFSNFGIINLLNFNSSNKTVLTDTYGYIAPSKFIR